MINEVERYFLVVLGPGKKEPKCRGNRFFSKFSLSQVAFSPWHCEKSARPSQLPTGAVYILENTSFREVHLERMQWQFIYLRAK